MLESDVMLVKYWVDLQVSLIFKKAQEILAEGVDAGGTVVGPLVTGSSSSLCHKSVLVDMEFGVVGIEFDVTENREDFTR